MRRLLMLLSALCLVLAAAGCSGDDGKGEGEDGKDPSADGSATRDPKDQRKLAAKITKCDAVVSTTGAHQAEWSGDATARTGGKAVDDTGPNAVYTLTDKNNVVQLYSPGPAYQGSISMTADGLAYSSDPADAESFDIDKRGKHAQVDATLTSISGDEIQLAAEFTCGKR